VNVVSRHGLLEAIAGKSKDVQDEANKWFRIARAADWPNFEAVRTMFPDADLVDHLLVFNIRHNRYRLIVLPVFERRKLYIKALLTHKEYAKGAWKNQWP